MFLSNKIKRVLIVIGAIMLLNITQNCSNSMEPNPPHEKEISHGIQPLKVGYFWIYRDYYLREDGSINNNIPYTEFKSLIRTTSSITIDDENYVVFNQTWTLTENEIYSPFEWRDIWYYIEAKVLTEMWRQQYNNIRPHSSLNFSPPVPEVIIPQRVANAW